MSFWIHNCDQMSKHCQKGKCHNIVNFLSNPPSLYQCCDGTHSLACMTGSQFKIWDVIVGGTFVPIVKWNKEAWGWNIRQLSMLIARSQQGVNPAIPHCCFTVGHKSYKKNTPNNRRSGAAPVGQQCMWSSSICETPEQLGPHVCCKHMMRCCGHQPQATGSNSTVPSISTGQPTVQVATTLTSEKTSKTSMNNHILFLE